MPVLLAVFLIELLLAARVALDCSIQASPSRMVLPGAMLNGVP